MARSRQLYPGRASRRTAAWFGGVGLLGFAVACTVIGVVSAPPAHRPVSGEPVAVPEWEAPSRARGLTDWSGPSVMRWGVPGGSMPAQLPPPPPVPPPPPPPPPPPEPSAAPQSTTAPAVPKPPQQPPAQRVPAGQRPGTVRLPEGGTATLVRRELGPDAELPVPEGVREATWWGAGLDASAGATVLAGHVNWKGSTGPFAELWRARDGQAVSVADAAGHVYRYRVTEVVTLHKNDLPAKAQDLFGQGGPHRLVLVTCGGRWVGGELGYDENRVVVAEPQP